VVGSRTVEVDEPLPAEPAEVEVVLRLHAAKPGDPARLAEYIRSLPPGSRSKEDIDRQVDDDRSAADQ
jgi:hypothetical protein